ncbi:maltose alpha-D-glucosyltransferase [Paraburkholderia sp. Ac-20340]|uniref:maltose alpha-D-glucosyltransferase n=1 Tax=Paraburkholderia sp. Ac-20340 TaxID=2703888 RepID=UPI00197E5BA8|nr:maltose alpha-D-glucosyltransferase [Paraburkholderia sp. Ac-20340]MBN3854010.1 maltose alpha-D-glucosyltransferase [Paraburkholderia sp. Ac-20340]
MNAPAPEYVEWLVGQSMLHQVRARARTYAGQARLWLHPYAEARPRVACAMSSVWLTAYPGAVINTPGESVLQTLGSNTLWRSLSSIGIQALHPGPTKVAGGLRGETFTHSVDGNFDRIGLSIDQRFGTEEQFVAMSRMAAAHNAVVIDDVVPSHTGKGPDFRLAEMNYGDYPGLYHMIEIKREDWSLLPDVSEGRDSVNLAPETVDALKEKCYIVGQLQRVIFFEPGIKETDWSATPPVVGVDGNVRRWVYLHYFKEGQPSLNWLDPTFAAQQLIIGDALHSLDILGARGLRLDANGFLGIERRPHGNAWSESHPLSITGNQLLGGAIRKAGGFSFQELNLTVDDIAAMSKGGADLSYDFITRPAYHHALLTGDTEFLRLMLRTVHQYGIDPASLIHALQNHDELTLELVHFWTLHANSTFTFQGQTWPGNILREHIRETMYERLSGEHAPYNLRFVTNGVSCTTASVIAAALNIRDLHSLSEQDKENIRQVHILLSMYNALQPGVFAISGWDLVGALPLPIATVEERMFDGDTRWIQRGAYDLTGENPAATESEEGIPRALALYGHLPEQLADPQSFASQLKHILAVRESYKIASSKQIAIPDVTSASLLVMVHELPAGKGTQVTALNFSASTVDETIELSGIAPGPVVDMLAESVVGDLDELGTLRIALEGYRGVSLRIVSALPTAVIEEAVDI